MKNLLTLLSLLASSVEANFQYQSSFDLGSGRDSNLTEDDNNKISGSFFKLSPKVDASYEVSKKILVFGSANLTSKDSSMKSMQTTLIKLNLEGR